MRKEYVEELNALRKKMELCEEFAQQIPLFADFIIANKLTGKDGNVNFGKKYKDLYLDWGINRVFYDTTNPKYVGNFKEKYTGYVFIIYINTLTLYDSHDKFGLSDAIDKSLVLFFDRMNTTFYIEDANIEQFLNQLNDWYLYAREQARLARVADKIKKETQRIEELEKKIKTLSEEGAA